MLKNRISQFLFFFLIVSLLNYPSFAQNLPKSYYDESIKSYKCTASKIDINFLLDSIQSNTIVDTALLACCYHQIGLHYFKKGNYLKATENNKLAAKLREAFNDGLYWKSLRNIGICYFKLNDFHRAASFFELAFSYYENKEPKYEISLLRYFAEILSKIGEYERAKYITKQALKINTNDNEISKAHRRIATIFIAAEDSIYYNEAIYHAKQAVNKSKKETTKMDALNVLGVAYYWKKEYKEAIRYYKKSLILAELIEDKRKQAIVFNNLANVNNEQKNYTKAINLMNKSLNLRKQLCDNKEFNFLYTGNYRNLANNYKESGQFDTSLFFYQKSLMNLTNQFREKNILKNPQFTDSLFIYSMPYLIEVLDLKAKAAYEYYKKKNDKKYLNLAENTYQTLLDFHTQLQQDISTENSRLLQAKKIVPFIEQALEIAYTKQQINNFDAQATFRLMEKNKATVLSQLMNENEALQFTNLPDSLREQEKDLKIAISFYDRRLNETKAELSNLESEEETKEMEDEINELENDLFEYKENYHRLIKNLEENYPDYYQFKYQQKESTLAEVQNQLDEQTALLEYFVGNTYMYIFCIQKHKTKLYQIEKSENWDQQINDFISLFKPASLNSDELNSSTSTNQFIEQANYLHDLLLQQPLNDLDKSITNLQIIPDAELNYLPFDVLFYEKSDTTTNSTFSNLPYLIKQKAIGYAYSANLWLDNLNTQPLQNPVAYGGYASQHSFEEEDIDLPIARKQVKSIAELFKGKSYLADTATKSAFLSDENAYNILHFAMHGKVNDTLPLNSHLVFTKTDSLNKLFAADLYNTKLQTNLAVLGACNTGTGKVQKGEGVMSLSRAFTFAGCPSLVMSLWSIPDASSAKVLDNFFTNLKEGLPKDVALQQAKLHFLETSEKSHPLYWAGLVAVGNLDSLHFKESGFPIWLPVLASCLFLVLLTFVGRGYFKKK